METLKTLIQFVQLGGLAASLVFLWLGYQLLSAEQNLKDTQGKPSDPRQTILDSIQKFLKFSLLFFVAGFITQVIMVLLERHFDDRAHIRLSVWNYDKQTSSVKASLAEKQASDFVFIPKAHRNRYDLYVAIRRQQPMRQTDGKYPIVIGPFDYGSHPEVSKILTAEQRTALGDECTEFVLFGVERPGRTSMEAFEPAALKTLPLVFHAGFSC